MPNTSDKYITDNKLAAANKSPSLSKKPDSTVQGGRYCPESAPH